MSISIYDTEAQQWGEVDEGKAAELLKDPRYTLDSRSGYNVVKDDGRVVGVTAEQIFKALQDGEQFRFETPDEAHERDLSGRRGLWNKAVAYSAETLGTLTFGGSDLAVNRLAPEAAADIAKDIEANPIAAGLGTASGIILPMLATAGGSTAVSGAAGAKGIAATAGAKAIGATPAGLAMKAGQKLAQKGIAGQTTAAAGEALLFGTGERFGEAVLGADPEENAEDILAMLGESAWAARKDAEIGGVLGFVLPGSAVLGRKFLASPAGLKSKEVAEVLAQKITGAAPKETVRKIQKFLENQEDLIAEKAAEKVGASKADVLRRARASQDDIRKAQRGFEKAGDEIGSDLGRLYREADDAFETLEAGAASVRFKQDVFEVADNFDEQMHEARKFLFDDDFSAGVQRKISETLNRAKMRGTLPGNNPSKALYDELLELEVQLQRLSGKAKTGDVGIINAQFKLNELLENYHIWGKAGSQRQSFRETIEALRRIDAPDAKTFPELARTLDATEHSGRDALQHYITSRQARLNELKKFKEVDLKPAQEKLTKMHQRLEDGIQEIKDIQLERKLKQFDAKNIFSKLNPWAVFGGVVGDVPGFLAGQAAQLASQPQVLVRKIATLKNFKNSVNTRLTNAAKTSRKLGKESRRLLTKDNFQGTRGLVTVLSPKEKIREKQRKEYEQNQQTSKVLENLVSLLQDPMQVSKDLRENLVDLASVAPEAANGLVNLQMQSAQFLLDKANQMGLTVTGLRGNRKYSQTILEKFRRYTKAVSNPMGVVDSLIDGSINPEGVEVLRNLYPKLYSRLSVAVFEEIESQPEQLPMQTLIAYSTLLQIPLTEVMKKDVIGQFQASHAVAAGQPQDQGIRQSGRPRGSQTKTDRVQILEENETVSQRLAR